MKTILKASKNAILITKDSPGRTDLTYLSYQDEDE